MHSELLELAEEKFHGLNLGEMWPVGGRNFKNIAKIIGFKKSLALTNIINKINLL